MQNLKAYHLLLVKNDMPSDQKYTALYTDIVQTDLPMQHKYLTLTLPYINSDVCTLYLPISFLW